MAESPLETTSTQTAERRPRTEDVTRRFLLPAGALASLALGLALMADPHAPTGVVTPYVLYTLGLGILATLAFFRSSDSPAPSPTARRSLEARALASPPVAAVLPPAPRPADSLRGSSRGSEWRVLSTPASPGDETWLSWLPPERRRLGSSDGGIVPGVIRSPGSAGTLVAFPVRSYFGRLSTGSKSADISIAPRSGSVAAPPPRSEPAPPVSMATRPTAEPNLSGDLPEPHSPSPEPRAFSVEELDRLFPPLLEGRRVFLSKPPQRVGMPAGARTAVGRPSDDSELSTSSDEEFVPSFREGPSSTVPASSGAPARSIAPSHELTDELTNPVPPHLRGTGPLIRADVPTVVPHRAGIAGAHRTVCASCSKVVMDLRMSGPCPSCMRPICNECLREAMVMHGHGWCIDCSASAEATSAT